MSTFVLYSLFNNANICIGIILGNALIQPQGIVKRTYDKYAKFLLTGMYPYIRMQVLAIYRLQPRFLYYPILPPRLTQNAHTS